MRSIFGDIRVRRSIQSFMLVAILLVTFMSGSIPAAQAQSGDLFGSADTANFTPQADAGPALRARYVSANVGLLLDEKGQPRDATAISEVGLNLFPDATYTGVVTKLENYDPGTHAWSGVLKDVDGGYFYLVTSGQTLMAHVASPKGVYEVSAAGDGVYRVVQIDQSKFVDEPNYGRNMPAGPAPAPITDLSAADTGDQIDVMVVYTPKALAGAGSLPALKAQIALAMTETNQGYANAGITTRLRLVHIQKVAYQQSGNIQKDVNRLASGSDGFMDNVAALRNQFGADMVSLIVDYGPNYPYCGIARSIMANAKTAFDVVARVCMTGYYSFGHEFGHLQGARHDTYVDSTMTPFSYGHGYVYLPGLWRTIMAYNNACSVFGMDCTRLQYWSNPTVPYGGQPMGDSFAQNYVVLNNTALAVANFRPQKIGSDFSSDFTSDATGWTPVYGTWSLGGGYLSATSTPGRFATVKHDGFYGDQIYQVTMARSGACTICANSLVLRGRPTSLNSAKVWRPSLLFEYTNQGLYSVWAISSSGAISGLSGWRSSSAIVPGGWNTLTVTAVGPALQFYINGSLVWARNKNGFATGQAGIGFYIPLKGASGEQLFVDSAALQSAPTFDVAPTVDVQAGEVFQGGSVFMAP